MTGNLARVVTATTGEHSMAKFTGGRDRPTVAEVSRLAYHFYELRGGQNGRAMEDWLLAEQELVHHYASWQAELWVQADQSFAAQAHWEVVKR